jgi:hypothetical protein
MGSATICSSIIVGERSSIFYWMLSYKLTDYSLERSFYAGILTTIAILTASMMISNDF